MVPFNSRSVYGTRSQRIASASQPQTHTVCRAQALRATHAPAPPPRRQGFALARAHANRNRRSPPHAHAAHAKTGPFGLTRSFPPHRPPRPADIPASKGRRIQPELLWVLQGSSCPGAAGEAHPSSPVRGSVVLISQELSKMLNKSYSMKNGIFWASYPPSTPGFAGLLKSWWSPFAILAAGGKSCF